MISDCPPTSRPFVVMLLSFVKDVSRREIARRLRESRSNLERHLRNPTLPDEVFERIIKALGASAAEVALATAFHEGFQALALPSATPAERDFIEIRILGYSRWYRRVLADFARFARTEAPLQKYPEIRGWNLLPASPP